MLVAAEQCAQGGAGKRHRPRGRQKALLDAPLTGKRVLDTFDWETAVLDGMNEGFEGGNLRARIRTTQQHDVASRGNRADGGFGEAILAADRLNLEIVGEDESLKAQVFLDH